MRAETVIALAETPRAANDPKRNLEKRKGPHVGDPLPYLFLQVALPLLSIEPLMKFAGQLFPR